MRRMRQSSQKLFCLQLQHALWDMRLSNIPNCHHWRAWCAAWIMHVLWRNQEYITHRKTSVHAERVHAMPDSQRGWVPRDVPFLLAWVLRSKYSYALHYCLWALRVIRKSVQVLLSDRNYELWRIHQEQRQANIRFTGADWDVIKLRHKAGNTLLFYQQPAQRHLNRPTVCTH